MATSSERSPPPFPDSEDQDLEGEEVGLQDSDEGDEEDQLFIQRNNPPTANDLFSDLDPVLPTDDITVSKPPVLPEPATDLMSDPLTQLLGQTESKPVSEVTAKVTAEVPAKALVDVPTEVQSEALVDIPTEVQSEALVDVPTEAQSEALVDVPTEVQSEALVDVPTEVQSEALVDVPTEVLAEVQSEALVDVTIEIKSEALVDVTAEVQSEVLLDVPTAVPAEVPSEALVDVAAEVQSEALVDVAAEVQSEALVDVAAEVQSDALVDVTTEVQSEALVDVAVEVQSEALVDVTTEVQSEALIDVTADVTSEPSDDFVDLTDEDPEAVAPSVITELVEEKSPEEPLEGLSSEQVSQAVNELASEIVSEPLDDFVDLSGNETEMPSEEKEAEEGVEDVTVEAASIETKAPESIIEPLGDNAPGGTEQAQEETSSAPLVETSSDVTAAEQPPISKVLDDPLADLISAAPPAELKKASKPVVDLFEDDPSDLFTESRQAKAVKQPHTSIFDEPDEDLFSEPLGATLTTAVSVVNSEKADKPVTAIADVLGGPLSEGFREEPMDIFSEEAVATVPSAVTSKPNGVHSEEEEPDIFAEATVELSLDSPRNDRKKATTAIPSVSAPTLSAAAATVTQPPAASLEELEEEEQEDKFDLNISITNPEKIGDGMNAYMAYKVSTQTTLAMFRNKTFTVKRRFSDFLGLYEKLSEKHSHSGFIVPPPPEKSILGMTKVKVGKEDPSSAEFVERRRAALERYLQRVVCHPSLLQDPDVREFLEREELPRAVNTHALSGAGFLKMISKATEAVSKMTIKMNESDVWFEEKLQEVEAEDQQLRRLHGMVESLVGHRKELSLNTASFAKSVAMLGSSEDNTALSRALSQLAEVEDKMEQLHQEQAANDSFNFAELLADYIRLLGSVRASFDHRMRAWQRWQDAQSMLQKKRETEAKLLWANKPDKLQQAKEEISEWEGKVTQFERDFDRVSATVRKEVLRFEKEKARDFKRQIVKYLESLLQSQQQVMKYWEAFLPEAKAIA